MLDTLDNRQRFEDVCSNTHGRQVIYTYADFVDETNVCDELAKAIIIHEQNKREINYLNNYYMGIQPASFREKDVRPEINNKVVENHAFEFVEFETAQNFGEPVQYVRRGTDEAVSDKIKKLNDIMYSESKSDCDIEIGRWRAICGTAYRFIYMNQDVERYDEAPFGIECLDPRDTFVCYSNKDGKPPMFSVTQRLNANKETYSVVYTKKWRFEIKDNEVVSKTLNGFNDIPVIEYPRNERRLSMIEMVISQLDAINSIQSDRVNGIEQFIQSFFKFKNCEIDKESFKEMRREGALVIKDITQGCKSDAELISSELNQTESQVFKDDLYDSMLSIIGMPSREQNTGGDTGQAVYLRNGWDFAEQRAEIQEPIFDKAERRFLKIVFNVLSTTHTLDLKLSDVEIKVTRSKTDNMMVKVNALQMLLIAGVDFQLAFKTVGLWSDPEEAFIKSKKRLEEIYSQKLVTANKNPQIKEEVKDEVVEPQ